MWHRRSVCLTALASLLGMTSSVQADFFMTTNLVTDDQSVNPAKITDPNLKNPWGVSLSATSPFWVSDNGTGTSTLYSVNPTTNATTKLGLTVTIPGNGSVTGQAFSGAAGNFNGDAFLFVSKDGTIAGWRGALGTNAEVLQTGSTNNVYTGTAVATIGTDKYLYSANFRAGTIEVLKGDAGAPSLAGNFTDPNLPSGYAPFNIQNLNGKLYVSYAQQDANKSDDVPGSGHGFVDAFDLQGNFLRRVASQGTLDSPWGMAIAPQSFGALAGDLLVGNFGNGTISAFDLTTQTLDGLLLGRDGNPLVIDGLWALASGNNGSGGSSQRIYFTAGPNDESNGLFGVLQEVPEPASLTLALLAAATLACCTLRSRTPSRSCKNRAVSGS